MFRMKRFSVTSRLYREQLSLILAILAILAILFRFLHFRNRDFSAIIRATISLGKDKTCKT